MVRNDCAHAAEEGEDDADGAEFEQLRPKYTNVPEATPATTALATMIKNNEVFDSVEVLLLPNSEDFSGSERRRATSASPSDADVAW